MRLRTVLALGAGVLGVAAGRARAERSRREAGAGSGASPGAKARAVIDLTLERARDAVDARIGRQGASEPPTVLADYYRTPAPTSSAIPA